MPNLRSKTWTITTPANVEDAQYWEDHLISDSAAAKAASSVQSVNNVLPDAGGNVDLGVTGHVIEDDDGTSMTQQPTLQFLNAEVSNDSVNDKTVVDCKGSKGDPGDAATIAVGTVTTLPAGSAATVTNSGTTSAAVFDFGIPKGMDGTGAVLSVNGEVGNVVLEADDIDLVTQIGLATDVEGALHVLASGKQDVITAGDGIYLDPLTLELSADLLAGSNINITPKNGALEISTIGGGGSTIIVTTADSTLFGQNVTITDGVTTLTQMLSGTGEAIFKGVTLTGSLTISTLGAQTVLNVPYFGNYSAVLATFSATINVYAPSGASISVAGNGESYTATGAGMSTAVPVYVHSVATYTVDCEYDGASKVPQSVTITTDGQTESVTFEYGTITLSVDADFVTAGSTITCVQGGTTLSKTAASTVTFYVPTTGSWTISSMISSDTYYSSPNPVVVSSLSTPASANLQTLPNGKTVTPTDDIELWLACAGLSGLGYTSLSQVLADSTTLLALMSDDNAVDYLVRSTTWANDVTADSTAMTDIGANNYCADTLLADADWCQAIVESTYRTSVLNVSVPTMTSNTAPSGEAFADEVYNTSYPAYKAFDNNTSDWWMAHLGTGNRYIGYKFTSAVKVLAIGINQGGTQNYRTEHAKLQGSNDNFVSDVNDIQSLVFSNDANTHYYAISNDNDYQYYRLELTQTPSSWTRGSAYQVALLQFYGREDV